MQSSTSGSRFTSPERAHDRVRGAFALDPGIDHHEAAQRPARPHHGDDVAERGAGDAGDHRDGARKSRQPALPRRVEEAVLVEQRLDPLELPLRGADGGGRQHLRHDELELTLLLVQRRPPEDEDLGPVLRRRARAKRVGPPHRAAHLARPVPQGEVPVAAGIGLALDHLALHPHRHELALDDAPGGADELGDGPDFVGGGDQGELGGHRDPSERLLRAERVLRNSGLLRPFTAEAQRTQRTATPGQLKGITAHRDRSSLW